MVQIRGLDDLSRELDPTQRWYMPAGDDGLQQNTFVVIPLTLALADLRGRAHNARKGTSIRQKPSLDVRGGARDYGPVSKRLIQLRYDALSSHAVRLAVPINADDYQVRHNQTTKSPRDSLLTDCLEYLADRRKYRGGRSPDCRVSQRSGTQRLG